MLEYCRLRQMKVKDLALQLQVSPTNFAKSCLERDMGSQAIVIFLQVFDEVSADWLLRDEGSMLRHDSELQGKSQVNELLVQNFEETSKDRIWKELVDSKNQIIAIQAEQLSELRVRLAKIEGVGQ